MVESYEQQGDLKRSKEGINKLHPKKATAMGEGVLTATQSLSEEARSDVKKIIVLLSDGMSNAGLHPLSAGEIARENNVTIFSVNTLYCIHNDLEM